LNLVTNHIFILNITTVEIDLNLLMRVIAQNQVFNLKLLADKSFEELWCYDIKDILVEKRSEKRS
jgi:hypothetical protein